MHLVTEKKDQEDRPQPEPLRNRADPRPHNTPARNTGHLERSFAQAAQGHVDLLNSEFETVQAAITLLLGPNTRLHALYILFGLCRPKTSRVPGKEHP